MKQKEVLPGKSYQLIKSLIRFLDGADKAYQITNIKTDTGKGLERIDNLK